VTDNSANVGRRRFLVGSTTAVGAAGVVGAAVPFVGSWNPSAKARAAGAPVRIDISRLQDGEMLGPIPAWRGRPIFVVKRSEALLAVLNEDPDRLTDPDSQEPEQPTYAQNEYRARRPDIMVLVGLCPHLFLLTHSAYRTQGAAFRRGVAWRFFLPLSRFAIRPRWTCLQRVTFIAQHGSAAAFI